MPPATAWSRLLGAGTARLCDRRRPRPLAAPPAGRPRSRGLRAHGGSLPARRSASQVWARSASPGSHARPTTSPFRWRRRACMYRSRPRRHAPAPPPLSRSTVRRDLVARSGRARRRAGSGTHHELWPSRPEHRHAQRGARTDRRSGWDRHRAARGALARRAADGGRDARRLGARRGPAPAAARSAYAGRSGPRGHMSPQSAHSRR